jgi:hypothetical protein
LALPELRPGSPCESAAQPAVANSMDDSNVTLKVVMILIVLILIVLILIVHVIGLWPHFLISLTKKGSDNPLAAS